MIHSETGKAHTQTTLTNTENLLHKKNKFFEIKEQKNGQIYFKNYKGARVLITKNALVEEVEAIALRNKNYEHPEDIQTYFRVKYGQRKRKRKQKQMDDEEFVSLTQAYQELEGKWESTKKDHDEMLIKLAEKEVDIEELKRKNETLSMKYRVLKKKAARYDHIMEMFVSPKNGQMFLNRRNIKGDKKSYKGYFVHDTTYFTNREKEHKVGHTKHLTPDQVKFLKMVDECIDGIYGLCKAHWRKK